MTSNFWGDSFIYNGVPSELYDLRIFGFEPEQPGFSPAGGEVVIQEEWLYRRERPYFYGRNYESSLEFDITVGSFNEIDGATRNAIQIWLLGKNQYKPFRIVQSDISDVSFNAILTRSDNIYVGNLNYALTLHVKCDRPWGIYTPPTFLKVYAGNLVTDTFNYINGSVYSGYNKPTISFTMDSDASYFSLINVSDNNREMRFDNLSPNETVTVDNDRGIITSSTGQFRMPNFNKKFFRLIQGTNEINLSGYITDFTLDTVFPKGIGA